jgi:hypothetical protein
MAVLPGPCSRPARRLGCARWPDRGSAHYSRDPVRLVLALPASCDPDRRHRPTRGYGTTRLALADTVGCGCRGRDRARSTRPVVTGHDIQRRRLRVAVACSQHRLRCRGRGAPCDLANCAANYRLCQRRARCLTSRTYRRLVAWFWETCRSAFGHRDEQQADAARGHDPAFWVVGIVPVVRVFLPACDLTPEHCLAVGSAQSTVMLRISNMWRSLCVARTRESGPRAPRLAGAVPCSRRGAIGRPPRSLGTAGHGRPPVVSAAQFAGSVI